MRAAGASTLLLGLAVAWATPAADAGVDTGRAGTTAGRPLSSSASDTPPVATDGSLSGFDRAGHRYLDGPPTGHTGGFGEPTCARCHFGGPEGPPPGGLSVQGLPSRYQPGRTYRVTVVLAHPGMGRAGFQLAIRFAAGPSEGEQAGGLEAADVGAEVVRGEEGAPGGDPHVLYARHTEDGTELPVPDTARWSLLWTAPGGTAGQGSTPAEGGAVPGRPPVVLHLAANAANDDASEFGDRIYTARARVKPPR